MSYNRYPDEKGTESRRTDKARWQPVGVTTVTPMKRGLKVLLGWGWLALLSGCYNRYPDEKGTERPAAGST